MITSSPSAHIFTLKQSAPQSVVEQSQALLFLHSNDSPLLKQNYLPYIQLIPYIDQWSIGKLYTHLIQVDKFFLYRISHITFKQLKHIDISCNNIDSIEQFEYLDCKKLVYLSLSGNNITCLKPIAKCGFGNLRSFDIGGNMLKHNELSHLTKYIASVQMHTVKLSIECGKEVKKSVEYAFVEQLFKFKANDVREMHVESSFLVISKQTYVQLVVNKLPASYVSVFSSGPN